MKLFDSSRFKGIVTREIWDLLVESSFEWNMTDSTSSDAKAVADLLGMSYNNALQWQAFLWSNKRVKAQKGGKGYYYKILGVLEYYDPTAARFWEEQDVEDGFIDAVFKHVTKAVVERSERKRRLTGYEIEVAKLAEEAQKAKVRAEAQTHIERCYLTLERLHQVAETGIPFGEK